MSPILTDFTSTARVRQGCPLSLILLNLFINDVLDKCDKFGVNMLILREENFVEDYLLMILFSLPQGKSALRSLLNKVYNWSIKNEMSFGIDKFSFVLSTVLYYALLFGSNKANTKKTQTALNEDMFWSFDFKRISPNATVYNLSKELSIPPIASFYVNAQIRSDNYKKYKFDFKKLIHRLTLQYSQYFPGFFWNGRIKCVYKFDVNIYKKNMTVYGCCPTYYPCCNDVNNGLSFTHWVMFCSKFNEFREQCIPSHLLKNSSLIFFTFIVYEKSLNIPDNSENDFEDNLKIFLRILCLLLGGNAIFEILRNGARERRHLINKTFQSQTNESSFPYSYIVGLAEFFIN
ncbi:hypothetical protein PIROE2DRAFT_14955 [Piromyces sp. E2]|nr:hypothetical protein PIROE2DRAFT_14955 [Piromyces sp. E2]|eukprot:OUM59502.1 hypothetical protein PIROE2DRAFT_14955 [Piromyces sp. E2]